MLPIQAQIYGMRLAGFDQPTLARVGECNRKHADGNSRISIRIPKDTQLMLLKTWRKTIGREPSSSFIENNPSHQINKNPVAATMSAANHSKAHIPDVVPLFEEPSPYSATGYCGQFFRTDQRKIIGWIASDSALEQNADALKVRIIGLDTLLCSVKPISAFDVDIECAFEKKFFFEVDIGEANEISVINNTHIAVLYRVNMHHTPSVSSEEKLLASKIRRLTGEVFNTNPLMIPDSTVSIIDWTIEHDERAGLRLVRFSCDERDTLFPKKSIQKHESSASSELEDSKNSRLAAAYSRITLTDLSSSQSPVILTCPLTPVCNLESDELEVAMRVRSDRPTWLICRLKRNGSTISTVETLINYQWSNIHRTLPGSNITPLFRTVNYLFEIELKHEGRGFVDFAACAIGLSPRLSQVSSSGPEGAVSTALGTLNHPGTATNRNFIRNGDFSTWSNGVTFQTFKPRQQTADGWRFECRDNQVEQVELQLVNVNEMSPKEKSPQRSYGLRVQTRDFAGPMRVVTVLDHSFLNATAAKLTIDLSVSEGCSPVQFLRRIYILGRSMGKEEVLHIIARKPRVHDHAKLVYKIDEPTLIKLRRTIGIYSSLLFVIEYEKNSDVVISSAELCQTEQLSSAEKQGNYEALSHSELCFEDAGIFTQSMTLNGLETWYGGLVKANISGENQKKLASGIHDPSAKPVIPSWSRPSRHYPTVDIVVPIYNALSALKDCLTSLVRETTVPYTLICVDDASSLETREFLAEFSEDFPHIRVVTNSENIGYTRNVNRGIENSTADWVCILNSDCIVTTNWLERLLDVAISSSKTGIVSPLSNAASYQSIPRIRNYDNEWSFNPLPATMQPNDMANLVWEHSLSAHPRAGVANGFCQLIRRDMLDSIGWLDEAAFPRGFGEENDLCARAVKSGWDIRIADDTYVYHVKSQSFGHKERKRLSKDGSSALKEKHPDVDWKLITNELENEHSLVELRKRLISAGI